MAGFSSRVRVTYRDLGLKKIVKNVQQTGVRSVQVGVVGAKANDPSGDGRRTVGVAALINQFGTDDGVIQPRPFLTEPYQKQRARVTGLLRETARRVISPSSNGEVALDWLGGELAKMVRDALVSGANYAHNKPTTILKKGFDHALVWTEALANAISHRLIRVSGSILEAGSAIGDYESFEYTGGGGDE